MTLSPMPHCDLGLIHFLLKCRDSSTHCTEFSSHTSAKSPSLSGRPNHHHLSSASGICQVSLEACHLSIYSGGGKAQLRACRMNLTRHQQIRVSSNSAVSRQVSSLCMGSYGLPDYFGEMPNSQSECFSHKTPCCQEKHGYLHYCGSQCQSHVLEPLWRPLLTYQSLLLWSNCEIAHTGLGVGAGGAVWESYRNFTRWSLAGEGGS